MKGPLVIIALTLLVGIGRSSVSLSSPIIPGAKFFPDERTSPETARLLSAESYISQSHDASPGPKMPTITILASDLATERHLIEREECNLLIIQNRKNHKSLDFQQDAAAGAVASYFTAVDTAFAHCLDYLKLINDPDEWDKDWYLMPFIRSLNNDLGHLKQRNGFNMIFNHHQRKRMLNRAARNPENLSGEAWAFIRHVGCGHYPAEQVDTPIPAKIHLHVRQMVFKIWGRALKLLINAKINELRALINHPMLAFLGGRLPSGFMETHRRMDNFGRTPIHRNGDSGRMLGLMIRDWSYLTKFKADLDALRMVYDWKQENQEGDVVVNLLHRCDGDEAFDLMRTALVSMGWDENDIMIVSDEIDD